MTKTATQADPNTAAGARALLLSAASDLALTRRELNERAKAEFGKTAARLTIDQATALRDLLSAPAKDEAPKAKGKGKGKKKATTDPKRAAANAKENEELIANMKAERRVNQVERLAKVKKADLRTHAKPFSGAMKKTAFNKLDAEALAGMIADNLSAALIDEIAPIVKPSLTDMVNGSTEDLAAAAKNGTSPKAAKVTKRLSIEADLAVFVEAGGVTWEGTINPAARVTIKGLTDKTGTRGEGEFTFSSPCSALKAITGNHHGAWGAVGYMKDGKKTAVDSLRLEVKKTGAAYRSPDEKKARKSPSGRKADWMDKKVATKQRQIEAAKGRVTRLEAELAVLVKEKADLVSALAELMDVPADARK